MLPASRDQPAAGAERGGSAEEAVQEVPHRVVHVDIAEVRTEEGKLYLFVAIDRTSKVAYAELHERATQKVAGAFSPSRHRGASVPAAHGADRQRGAVHEPALGSLRLPTQFQRACREHGIEHRLTKPNHRGRTVRSSG